MRVICNSLLNNNGVTGADSTIKLHPAKSIVKYKVGDKIAMTKAAFTRLSKAYLAELERKYS